MEIDLIGRIKNAPNFYSKPLMPIFEAIVNSIHAIEDTKQENGYINVYIERVQKQDSFLDSDDIGYIENFRIEDNGIGFNEDNFKSFQKSDSTHKATRGGKGIGRFLWLKSFDNVHIESIFQEKDNAFCKRVFDFQLTAEGVVNHSTNQCAETQRKTLINLQKFKDKYAKECPRRLATIGQKIIEHCLVYFLSNSCPVIKLISNNQSEEDLTLNELFKEQFASQTKSIEFHLKHKVFNVRLLRLYSSEETKHLVHFCANNRVVLSKNLSKAIPDLNKKLIDENGRAFVFSFYTSGKYLDDNVNAERTDFSFVEDDETLFAEEISEKQLLDSVAERVKENLKEYLDNLTKDKLEHTRNYIEMQAPQFRHLLKYTEYLRAIPANLDSTQLDTKLYEIDRELNSKLKEQANSILKTNLEDIKDLKTYKEEYYKFLEEINDVGKAKLAQYVIHRRLIIDLLGNNLNMKNGSYQPEASIHEIIFPMQTTSDEILYEQQNLWLIDERLSYHKFLASDKRLDQIPLINISSEKRPDIIIFNSLIAFAENEPYDSIVIIEFKKPCRDEYTDDENPINQIYNYIDTITDKKAKDAKGRPIYVRGDTPFYCYIICDITNKIETYAKRANCNKTPDGFGYYGFNEKYSAYIEILSYTKLINDARKRNRVLFEKLNIPQY